jgi:hypothetical protein
VNGLSLRSYRLAGPGAVVVAGTGAGAFSNCGIGSGREDVGFALGTLPV